MREPEGFARLSTLGPASLQLSCEDDFTLAATCYEAAGTPRAIIVVAPSLGLPRRFYSRFGEFMASQGVACLTFDYRGVGESVPAEGQHDLITLEAWGRQDIDAAIRGASVLYPGTPIFLVGHGCGGQLFGLAPGSKQLAGAILVASGMPHPSRYPRPDRWALKFFWRILAPLYTRGKGHLGTTLPGMDGAQAPKAVYRQWARWCLRKDYLFDKKFGIDTTAYSMLNIPMMSISISDDEQSPASTISALLKRFPAATIERRIVDVLHMGYGSVGHLGFFRNKTRDALWFPVLNWMMRHRGRA